MATLKELADKIYEVQRLAVINDSEVKKLKKIDWWLTKINLVLNAVTGLYIGTIIAPKIGFLNGFTTWLMLAIILGVIYYTLSKKIEQKILDRAKIVSNQTIEELKEAMLKQ